MPIKFNPLYTITPAIARSLMRIEAARQKVSLLPVTPSLLASLRETAKLYTTHYSTMIEGNRLDANEVKEVLTLKGHFPGRERDENEIKGYYAALAQLEKYVARNYQLSEDIIKTLHALVVSNGRTNCKPTPYRDGQNVIKDGSTGAIIYMPPEAKDVSQMMHNLVLWIQKNNQLPCPLIAAIAHYQCATIHPYYDGNGRTARLLTTFILHVGHYDLKGLYSLEEYYAKNLNAYYHAITIGPSHNYYCGRAESDITKWIEYFIEGMAFAFEKVITQMSAPKNRHKKDQSMLLQTLDPKQRKALELLKTHKVITSKQIGDLFGFKPRTNSALCQKWVLEGFIEIVNHSNKARSYCLTKKYKTIVEDDL